MDFHPARAYRTTKQFFAERIWEQRLDQLTPRRARWYRAARIFHGTLKSILFEDTLQVRAAALTYFTVLSLVPLLAFAFALLKGFGAYDLLVSQTIRPYVLKLLEGNQALRTAFDQILAFVDRTGVTSLGFIGLLTLLYAATRLLRNIEDALNGIWGVKSGRQTVQQLRDYVAIIVVTPLCLMAGAGLATASQALSILRNAGETLGLGAVFDQLLGVLTPLFALFVGLLFLYKVMPYTNVRFVSALIGATVGAVLWFVVLVLHVRFQVGVAQYNALYSSFGAIPIFLAWLQVSWLMVLVGAQIAALHQNNRSLAQQRRLAEADQAYREELALGASVRIASAFSVGQATPTLRALACEFDVPEPLLDELLARLAAAGLLARTAAPSEGFVLARPPESIRIKDVLDALRHALPSAGHPHTLASTLDSEAVRYWRELDEVAARAPENRSLLELVRTPGAAAGEARVPPALADGYHGRPYFAEGDA